MQQKRYHTEISLFKKPHHISLNKFKVWFFLVCKSMQVHVAILSFLNTPTFDKHSEIIPSSFHILTSAVFVITIWDKKSGGKSRSFILQSFRCAHLSDASLKLLHIFALGVLYWFSLPYACQSTYSLSDLLHEVKQVC